MLASASSYIDVGALLKILLIGLVAGVGLTAVFSLGVSGLSRGDGAAPGATRSTSALVLAVLCFLVVAAGIGYGISVALTK